LILPWINTPKNPVSPIADAAMGRYFYGLRRWTNHRLHPIAPGRERSRANPDSLLRRLAPAKEKP
jgi:hypothetical protein